MMPAQQAVLRITGPDLAQEQLIVPANGLQIGRVRGNDFVLDQPRISRKHVRFTWQAEQLFLTDLNSTNGTWVGDTRLTPHEDYALQVGDVIRLGPFVLTLERITAGPAVPPMPSLLPEEVAENALRHAAVGSADAAQPPAPPAAPTSPPEAASASANGAYPVGIPRDESTWLQFLPAIYADPNLPGTDFLARFLLIFESIMTPYVWGIDNFDLFLSVNTAPADWLAWFAGWFDLLLLPNLPVERQRLVLKELGGLFLRRGTKSGLERLLSLYFDVTPDIIEATDQACHFVVRLPMSQSPVVIEPKLIERLIESQKPAFASFSLEVT